MAELSRRGFISGAASLLSAPAIVRASSLMQVRAPRVLSAFDLGTGDATVLWVAAVDADPREHHYRLIRWALMYGVQPADADRMIRRHEG